MQLQNPITPQIEQTINYHTNRLARSFRLQPTDKEDIRQELTLKTLSIIEDFEEGEASLVTYTKRCLQNKASDIARTLRGLPPTVNSDNALTALEIQEQYEYSANRSKAPVPLTVSMGGQLQHVSACNHEYHLPLKMDIEAILQTLTSRQRQILKMLEDDKTQGQIAEKLGMHENTIYNEIQRIRKFFMSFAQN